jgi:hypothetical protein
VPTQFETVVYVKSRDNLEETARRIFSALGGGDFQADNDPALGGDYFRLSALGFEGTVFGNEGEMEDEDFAEFGYGFGIVTTYLDPDLEMGPAETPLAEYFAHMLAFQLDLEVATSVYVGPQEGVDVYEIRAFKRNPQFTLDAGPLAKRVYVSERRTVEYDSELVEGDFEEDLDEEEEN